MERIMKYLNRVYRASVLDREAAFRSHNLTGAQVSYILHICRREGMTQDEIAESLFVNKSSVARQLARLENNGFIRREIDEGDRRNRRVYPTSQAKNLYPRIIEYLEDWNDALTKELDNKQQEDLLFWVRYLAKASTTRLQDKQDKDVRHVLGIDLPESTE